LLACNDESAALRGPLAVSGVAPFAEAHGVRVDCVDGEPALLVENLLLLVVPASFEQQNVAEVVAKNKATVREPRVASPVLRHVLLLLNLSVNQFQMVALLESIIFKQLLSCDQDHARIHVAERDLVHSLGLDNAERLVSHVLLLVPGPQDDFEIRLARYGDDQFVVVGTEVDREELASFVVSRNQETLLFKVGLVVYLSVCLLLLDALEELAHVVDRADSFVGSFAYSEMLLVRCHGQSRDALAAFDAGNVPLRAIVGLVNHDVVPAGVEHVVLFQEEDVFADVSLVSKQEFGGEMGGWPLFVLLVNVCVADSVDLLSACLHLFETAN